LADGDGKTLFPFKTNQYRILDLWKESFSQQKIKQHVNRLYNSLAEWFQLLIQIKVKSEMGEA